MTGVRPQSSYTVRLSLIMYQREMCAQTSCRRVRSLEFGIRVSGIGGGVKKQDVADAERKADKRHLPHTKHCTGFYC